LPKCPLAGRKAQGTTQAEERNTPQFDLREGLFRMSGTDLTRIDGIDVMTATTILSEVGWDMNKWATEDHFVSWLRLCPDNRISGDRIIGKGRLRTNNRVSIALKMTASSLRLSNTYLGAQFRRLRTKLGGPIAIKAMAAKLARLVYRMLRYGMKYVDQGALLYQAHTANYRSSSSSGKPSSLDFVLSKLMLSSTSEFLGRFCVRGKSIACLFRCLFRFTTWSETSCAALRSALMTKLLVLL
jgi:Transposase IS116/IS110/IS902 family